MNCPKCNSELVIFTTQKTNSKGKTEPDPWLICDKAIKDLGNDKVPNTCRFAMSEKEFKVEFPQN